MNSAELARQGDPHAIADLINRNLQPKGIAAKTSLKESCLKILLESEDVPDQKVLANYIYQGVKRLEIQSIQKLVVFGRKAGEELPNWTQHFELNSPQTEQDLKDLQTLTAVQPTVQKQKAQIPKQKSFSLQLNSSQESLAEQFSKLPRWGKWATSLILVGSLSFTSYLYLLIKEEISPHTSSPAQISENSSSTSTSSSPASGDIGKTDVTGTTITVNVPDDKACHRSHVSVKLDTFQKCLVEDMTFVQVSNTLGYPGELQAQSGSAEIRQWNDGSGKYLSATFVGGRLKSKSQIGLEESSDP